MRTIYVCCIAHNFTGGITLAHQLCFKLREKGFNSQMYYYYGRGMSKDNPINDNYKKYNLPVAQIIDDKPDNIFIAPEVNVNILRRIKHAKKMIWWMSVDNYFNSLKSRRVKIMDLFGLRRFNIKSNEIFHLAQSYYAISFLKDLGIKESNIFYLSDYLDSNFISSEDDIDYNIKENIVLYNPSKGYEFTSQIIKEGNDIKWIPLVNLTPSDLIEIIKKAKVYIDFGNHPGKDRIPRETAILGCCIITGKRGSANFYEDVSIPDKYKFDDLPENIPLIISRIRQIFNNYDVAIEDFLTYRQKIRDEEKKFESDMISIFTKI